MYSYNIKQSRKNYCYVDGKRVKKVHFDLIDLYSDRKDSFLSDSKTKYTVTHLLTGGVVYFDSLEQARIYALNCGDCVAIREPRYCDFVCS